MSDRGFRNCNPGNIRHGTVKWQGMAIEQTDPDFVQFTDPVWGLRAIARIMYSYERDGITTIDGAINRWAPPADNNNTSAYLASVCSTMSRELVRTVTSTSVVDVMEPRQEAALIVAQAIVEVGSVPFTDADLDAGLAMAGVTNGKA